MPSFLHLKSFHVYNIILFLLFALIVNFDQNFFLLYSTFYCIFHILLIYLGVYNNRAVIYLIYFLYGLGLDILWLHEIGPHLLVFMTSLILLNQLKKYLYNASSLSVYFFLIFFQISMIFCEMIFAYILFNIQFNFSFFLETTGLLLLLSYPIFLFFSKIDTIK